ncbi:uncharacterized protein P884DRAFT_190262 [Thermothelomyces heterothallicus CBS 202.75]|uniref:uncharacterized protein n=1 Tax=Thermothelomyces heterothallicus CBS 202.75 TaxID=1149848 RepID=UPI0037422C85
MLQSLPAQSGTSFASGNSHRHSHHGLPSNTAPATYHGGSGATQQYHHRGMSNHNPAASWQQSRTQRTTSSPAVPTMQSLDYLQPAVVRPWYSASASMTNLPSTANYGSQMGVGTRDDSGLPVPGTPRPSTSPRLSQPSNGSTTQSSLAPAAPLRTAPERYRRSTLRGDSTGTATGAATSAQLRVPHSAVSNRPNSFVGSASGSAIDDAGFSHNQPHGEFRRVRRRSMPALDSPGFPISLTPHELKQLAGSNHPRNADSDGKAGKTGNSQNTGDKTSNDEQAGSGRIAEANASPSSSANRNGSDAAASPTMSPSPDPAGAAGQDSARVVSIPPRTSSTDVAHPKRAPTPSPLSKPVTMDTAGESDQVADAPGSATQEPASPPRSESPAAKQLAAINEKRGKSKSKTSRLRRAFSFGSAAEFRKAANDSEATDNGAGKLHKDRIADDAFDEEQARIAERQEAAGIGNNIYSGGRFFHGSTDNLSISSTASSASIMIRKMGRGMKKGTRSLVGLFRPKSIVGTPAADEPPVAATQSSVSMITAEAERERVNVSADPKAQGGGTGFPRLERNSIDASKVPAVGAERAGSSETDSTKARKSIVGGEKERAEVLAAVRKGILKNRTGSSSPSPRPSDPRGSAFDLPSVPSVTDSPNSSAPSTPNEDSQGHRRPGAVTIGSEDYFVSALRLRQDSNNNNSNNKATPGTPQSTKRCTTFSPRIVFFETWPSQEYDRRGDIATCNRLTPMLAQQIKEELNSFKMEMEVHENSKIYTHFF